MFGALLGFALFSAVWLPIGVWLLVRARAGAASHRKNAQALQAQLAVELFRSTRRDPLTGLPCRAAFLDTMAACLARDAPAALLVIDVDGFAAINSTHGETVGDEVLGSLAGRLRSLTGQHGHLARLDGDSFSVLLDRPDTLENLPATVEHMRKTLTMPHPVAGQLLDLPLSIGVARAPHHADTAENLLRAAHLALAQVKSRGGGGWIACGPELSRRLRQRAQMHGQLRRAVADGRIVPWYQPIVRVPSGEIARYEVLARWIHPELGILTADQFIPMADEMGLSGQISMALLRQVAVDSRTWPDTCRFAINVSSGQVRELIGFFNAQPGDWQRRMDLSRLDVEITEAALMRDRAMARELIDTLHEHGARAGLDNFGSGISNFSFLRDMPFDSIKIGKAFVQTMLDDARAQACVMSMLWLGHGLGVDVVADGVETEAVSRRLAEIGCTLAQGFYYARPGPAADVTAERFPQPGLTGPTSAAVAAQAARMPELMLGDS